MIDPIAIAHGIWIELWNYRGLILAGLLVGLVTLAAWFALRHVFVVTTPRRVALKKTLKRFKVAAREYGFAPKQLRTRGTSDRRIAGSEYGRIAGGFPTGSVWIVLKRPRRGLFRFLKAEPLLVARHLLDDVNSRVLELKAVSLSKYEGPIWIPNDDLSRADVREAWETLLAQPGEGEVASADLATRIRAWYARIIDQEVMTSVAINAIDATAENFVTSMSRDFTRRPQRLSELVPSTLDDPLEPATESGVRA